MLFSAVTLLAALAGSALAAPAPALDTRGGSSKTAPCPTPSQWTNTFTQCQKQTQNGVVNVGVELCVLADVNAIISALGNPTQLNISQIEPIFNNCQSQTQNGVINIGLEICVAAEIDLLISALTDLPIVTSLIPRGIASVEAEKSLVARGGSSGKTAPCPTPSQWTSSWTQCQKQTQNGLVNVGVELCILADVNAIISALGSPLSLNITQLQPIFANCQSQTQNGLINVGLEICVAAEVDLLISALSGLPIVTSLIPRGLAAESSLADMLVARGGSKKPCPSSQQWNQTFTQCQSQDQNGLINIGLELCVLADVNAILSVLGSPSKLTIGELIPIFVKCQSQTQNGLINVGVEACIEADVNALLQVL